MIKNDMTEQPAVCSVISISQHRVTKKRSCLTNLLSFLENVYEMLDEGWAVDVVLAGSGRSICSGVNHGGDKEGLSPPKF